MNYQEALAYIYSFTDFERGGSYKRDRNENLPRIASLLALLGNPLQNYTCTLIAGTKGKGSTAALIESVLRAAGMRTGLYTQPDLHTFRERIRVNGRLISEADVAALVPEIKSVVEQVEARHEFGPFITYEIGTALAFLYFSRKHVQHAVLEVGLGGRLDATNISHPLVSVITSISFDHMHILGNTLAEIATEKAGIIKSGGTVVTSAQSVEALLAIAAVCQQRQARLIRVGAAEYDPAQAEVVAGRLPPIQYAYRAYDHERQNQRFTIQTPKQVYDDLEIPLLGIHQVENATVALATLDMLLMHDLPWDEQALRQGFATVHWPGRVEIVSKNPTIVVDSAHNADSMEKLVQTLRFSFHGERLLFVVSVSRDKDLEGIVRALASVNSVILTQMNSPRVVQVEVLQRLFSIYAPQVEVRCVDDSQKAMDLAVDIADEHDLICATGSLYLAGEALRWAAAHGSERAASEIEGIDH